MIYLIIYIFVGLVISAFVVKDFCSKVIEKDEPDKVKDTAIVLSLFFFPLFCVPLWPMLITIIFIKLLGGNQNVR